MNILSVQSEVVYGHVGQGAARFALQCLGHEVWAIPSVLLSSHAGYATVAGEPVAADLMGRLIGGLEVNGWLDACDAVLSGYLGQAEQAQVVAEAVRRVKRANPAALYCLDPVFGDEGRAYAKRGVAEAMAKTLLPLADIVAPNAFELASLSSVPVRNPEEALTAARRLGRPLVLATSVPDGEGRIGTLAATAEEAWLASTPRLEHAPHGAGDLTAALFLAHRLQQTPLQDALAHTIEVVFRLLQEAGRSNSDEIPLIARRAILRKRVEIKPELEIRAL
ncbi:MAG: pyridoxal kinase [Alphaproteobacteria bacterium]|nr:pyridoxal kinase [Alphaproteobacteria bacterium]